MDDLGLMRDGDRDGPPGRRPWGLLVAGLFVTLLVVGVLVWVTSRATGGGGAPAAASPEATTPTPTGTTQAATTPAPDITTATRAPTASGRPAPPPAPLASIATRTARPTPPPPPPPNPQLVRVPDVTGLRLLRAVLTLRAAGFVPVVPGELGPGPLPERRRVSAQSPPAGTLAPRGSAVVLELDRR